MSVDLVRIVDSIHRDKNIPKEILFEGIESALATAAKKHYPDASEIQVMIDPETGKIQTVADGSAVEPPDFGRIAAQTAKQVIIQKIREAERDSLFEEFSALKGELITGTVQRFEGGAVTVNLGKTDAILPRSDQIPGDDLHPGERVRAIIKEVKKAGQRVKIILSRTHPDFVRRLFELEIPEIADGVIVIRALAREAGFRSKVAVTSLDQKVDAVGACVGVRGTRIKNIVDELGGERIDIVRWNESFQVLIPNALQPATVEEVMLCTLLGRAIVLVGEDQLSLAIGRRGQNVRLASKLVGWDIEIMTAEDLEATIERSVRDFCQIEGMEPDLAERLVEHGVLSYDDLSVMEPEMLVETVEGLDPDLAASIIAAAEVLAEQQPEDTPRRKPRASSADGQGEGEDTDGLAAPAAQGQDLDADAADESSDESQDEPVFSAAQTGLELSEDVEPIRDLALAEEPIAGSGHEVTFPPPDADQSETERIVTEAVEGEEDEIVDADSPDSD